MGAHQTLNKSYLSTSISKLLLTFLSSSLFFALMEDYTGATYVQSPQRQGYESNDPFTSSISQRVQNSRVVPQNMDDVPLPPDGFEGYYTGDDPYVVGPHSHLYDRPTVGATDPHHFQSGRWYNSSNSCKVTKWSGPRVSERCLRFSQHCEQ